MFLNVCRTGRKRVCLLQTNLGCEVRELSLQDEPIRSEARQSWSVVKSDDGEGNRVGNDT